MTLLEKAQTIKPDGPAPRPVDAETVELLIAWLNGDVSNVQARKAFAFSTDTHLYQKAGSIIRGLRRQGLLTLTLDPSFAQTISRKTEAEPES